MRAKHDAELQLLHALQVAEFPFQFTYFIQEHDQIEDDKRTLKFSIPGYGNYLHFMDIYSGQTMYVFTWDDLSFLVVSKHDLTPNTTDYAESSTNGLNP